MSQIFMFATTTKLSREYQCYDYITCSCICFKAGNAWYLITKPCLVRCNMSYATESNKLHIWCWRYNETLHEQSKISREMIICRDIKFWCKGNMIDRDSPFWPKNKVAVIIRKTKALSLQFVLPLVVSYKTLFFAVRRTSYAKSDIPHHVLFLTHWSRWHGTAPDEFFKLFQYVIDPISWYIHYWVYM